MAWTPNGNPRSNPQKNMDMFWGIVGWAIIIIGGAAAVGAYRQGKFDSFINAFWAGYQGTPVVRAASAPQVSVWNCPESDGSTNVYTVDPSSRIVTADTYNRYGNRFCRSVYRDGVTGPITSTQLCSSTNGMEILAVAMMTSLRVRQTVSMNGNTVSFGGLVVGGLLEGQRQDATLNLSTGALVDPNGSRMTCRVQ